MKAFATSLDTPIGQLFVFVDEDGALIRLDFGRDTSFDTLLSSPALRSLEVVKNENRLEAVTTQLHEYFKGQRREFTVPLRLNVWGTAFRQRVWQELLHIPYGATWSYGQLAARLGDAGASRAVGAANGANPIAIIVPCHRVIGANGSLTGYGGGLENKKRLLSLEAEHRLALPELQGQLSLSMRRAQG